MPAYLIADVEVHDAVGYEAYRHGVPDALGPYGGRYLARGGATVLLEGAPPPNRSVVIEFPSLAKLQAFWNSSEYRPLREVRERTAKSRIYAVEGLDVPLSVAHLPK